MVSCAEADEFGIGHEVTVARFVFLIGCSGMAASTHAIELAPTDARELARRFEREIWPLLTRGEESCVACHDGLRASFKGRRGSAVWDGATLQTP